MKETIIKVIARGDSSTPCISLQGEELTDNGFFVGDMVRMEIDKNKIVITKNDSTERLTAMSNQNPALNKLIKNLDLTIL